jgi:hypothetical protein
MVAAGALAMMAHAQTNVIFVTIDDLSRESLGIHNHDGADPDHRATRIVEDKLLLEFVRRRQAADLTYTAQFIDNLMTTWTDVASAEQILPIDDDWERVTVANDATVANASNRFGRVIVIRN